MVVSKMAKALRKGKIFVDWSQNDEHKTTICVYSLRARDTPTASTPVTWEEVEVTVKKKNGKRLVFRCDQTLARVEKMRDLFEQVATLKQSYPGSGSFEARLVIPIPRNAEGHRGRDPASSRRQSAGHGEVIRPENFQGQDERFGQANSRSISPLPGHGVL